MNTRQLHARRAAAARWNRPEGQQLGQVMAWDRLVSTARDYRRQFGPIRRGSRAEMKIGQILWGVEPPRSQKPGR